MIDTASTWKIALPAAAPRAGHTSEERSSPDLIATAQQIDAANGLSKWLSENDLSAMKDRDIEVLSRETSVLSTAAASSRSLWKAFPDTAAIPKAQEVAERFRSFLDENRRRAEQAESFGTSLGLAWHAPAAGNVETAERLAARLQISAKELSELATGVSRWLGIEPTIRDAAYLVTISSSLRGADLAAMSGSLPTRGLVEAAMGKLEDIDRISTDFQAEFGFDPSLHSLAAFGGVERAFASGRAQDFILATRKLGLTIKGAEQAQRAAALFKSHIAAVGSVGGGAWDDSGMNEACFARARLARSIRRRANVMPVDPGSLSTPLVEIELQDFTNAPAIEVLALNHDTRALIEDNIASAPDRAAVSELANEVAKKAIAIDEWVERQRGGLLLVDQDSSHAVVEAALARNPSRMEAGEGLTLSGESDLEQLEAHINWLGEAAMLPLSDQQLQAFLAHAARRAQ